MDLRPAHTRAARCPLMGVHRPAEPGCHLGIFQTGMRHAELDIDPVVAPHNGWTQATHTPLPTCPKIRDR